MTIVYGYGYAHNICVAIKAFFIKEYIDISWSVLHPVFQRSFWDLASNQNMIFLTRDFFEP